MMVKIVMFVGGLIFNGKIWCRVIEFNGKVCNKIVVDGVWVV